MSMSRRIHVVFILFLFLFLVVIIKLLYWQVINSDELKGIAEKQISTTLDIPAQRGRIYSSDKSPLVINQRSYLVYLEPNKTKNINQTIKILSKDLEMNESSVSAKITNSELIWVPIARKITEEKMIRLKNEKLDGIGFVAEPKRYYPEASMAAHLLGFIGKNTKGSDQGYFGVEGYYDNQLRGRDGFIRIEKDVSGNPILSGRYDEIPAELGRDLVLTIDRSVQFTAEKKLLEGIQKFRAKGGSVIILNPKTGAVLAMVSYPSFDPDDYIRYPSDYYKNPTVSSSYEPGSTFKVLVMASALNEGKIKADLLYEENGPVEIGGYTINTWNQKYHGKISMSQILEYSSNVGMIYVESKLGDDNFIKYITELGFGKPTDVDLEGESSPDLRPLNKWYKIDYATASFGQGIAVTPLQMVRAVAAIANGGKLLKPYVVQSIVTENGNKIETQPKVIRQVFKKEVAAMVTEMMVAAVDNGETRNIKPSGFRIAGKTGTAQIPIQGHYDTQKTIASFVGFAPVDDPKFIMLVTINEPASSPWGSETAAPVFFSIASELFSYYGLSPSS